MQRLLELKHRIKTVENIETITRTLATVSAAKLSRTRRRAAGLREYSGKMQQILFDQQRYIARVGLSLTDFSPLFKERERVDKIALLVITADRGMCGGYNLAVTRLAADFWEKRRKAGQEVKFILKGEKGDIYFKKRKVDVIHSEKWRRQGVLAEDVDRLLALLVRLYLTGEVAEIYTVYTQFYSPTQRIPVAVRLLPIKLKAQKKQALQEVDKWFYEPSFKEIIDELLAIYLRVQLFDILLESFASEQGSRMITMEEATERAEKALKECRVLYNRLRREAITLDLLTVLFASEVMEDKEAAAAKLN